MRQITSLLIGGFILAWMAYLSWPVTADFSPPTRDLPREVQGNVRHQLPAKSAPASDSVSTDDYCYPTETKHSLQPAA